MKQSTIQNQPWNTIWSSARLLTRIIVIGVLAEAISMFAADATPETSSTNSIVSAEVSKTEKPPPLPLHQIEGNGGIFSTLSAYLVNPPRNGELVGRPSVGFAFVDLGQGRELEAFTLTETPWKRLELGFAYDNFDLGDLPQAIHEATSVKIGNDSVGLYNANARLQILKENDFDTKWIPALTAGVHYKNNSGINSIDHDLGGALEGIGIENNEGVDFTLYASKLFTFLPRPVLLELGARATEGAHLGLLGFTDNYSLVFEGNLVVFITDRLALATEYRQKPDDYQRIPGLIGHEDDWWTIDAAYVVNKHLTLAAGYGHFGEVLNHSANAAWGLTAKWEF